VTILTEKARMEMDELANRLFEAIERKDIDTLKNVYSPDVVYWMNAMPGTKGLDAVLDLVGVFHQKVNDLHYEVESREFFSGGFVQRCKIAGTAASGQDFAVPLCLVIYVEEGRIKRLYEYIDIASMMPVLS
jgi:ketosteroid isomerase-like protein